MTYDEVLDAIERLEVGAPFLFEPDWPARRTEAFPGSRVWAIVSGEKGLSPADFTWGYRASWSASLLYNTRIETAARPGGMWADSIERRRCIVPTFGFFEPHRTETVVSPRTGRPVKRPYLFASPELGAASGSAGPSVTLLGGIYENDRLSIVTTEPNSAVSAIHNRMPIVIEPEEVGIWLSPDYTRLADRSAVPLAAAPADPPASLPDSPSAARRARGRTLRADSAQLRLF